MTKIEKIEKLTFNEFQDTILNIANRLGYKDTQKDERSIVASNSSPLSSETYLFIPFNEKLSGNVDMERIKNEILSEQSKHVSNVIFIVSQFNISDGFENSMSKIIPHIKLNYIERDKLIKLIDEYYIDFWKHEDLMLIEYEKEFCQTSLNETDLKKLKIFNDKYQKLLDIYIEPRIYQFYEDRATQTPSRKLVHIEDLLTESKPLIISGEAGTGKSTLLKRIGEILIEKNLKEKNNVPVYITATEIYENEYKISTILYKKIHNCFPSLKLSEFLSKYHITILIDSIDEFEQDIQKSILRELHSLSDKRDMRYVIGTRNYEKIIAISDRNTFNIYSIERFNSEQIKRFVARFFGGEEKKAEDLIETLKENRIIERLPITPLTLSLISILYEENNLEIPATIADIYDNFNSLIIGRSTVTSRIEFIDISFKERILSLYALHLLERNQHTPLSKEEFFQYFIDYFSGKTLPIKKGTLEDVLGYLIDNTGVLILKNNKWVQFSHDSYMEYYGALEIFKHQREREQELIDNFFENNWQNAAIFYAGKSKDLPLFLKKIIEKIKGASIVGQFFMGVLGCGYLLQALYQTDNQLRKEAILEALELNIKANDIISKLAADEALLFKNYKLSIIQIMSLMYFYETFNSVTIKEPLKLAFTEINQKYLNSKNSSEGFKAIKLAITLDSKRINEPSALSTLMDNKDLFKDPVLYLILDFSFSCFGSEKYKNLKDEIRKDYYPNIKDPIRKLIELPAHRLRYTNLDTISSNKKVKIIVEGKTDAEIIEHAFYVLTGGYYSYWKIERAGNDSGGAAEVAKTISTAKPLLENDNYIIGLFDHDHKGLQEFRGLKEHLFTKVKNDTLKKHVDSNIYAMVLPIPGEMDYYLKKEQSFNFFEIEHYFDFQILYEHSLLEKTDLENIYKIRESKKKDFSKFIRSQTDIAIFKNFIELFKLIDEVTDMKIDYLS